MAHEEILDLRDFVRRHRPTDSGFLERKLWDLAERAPLGSHLIGTDADPYLLRVYVSPRTPQFQWLWDKLRWYSDIGEFDPSLVQGIPHLYLHHFFRGDLDRELHNHPWEFSLSLILTNGYIEERWDGDAKKVRIRRLYPGDLNVIRATDFHRVILRNPDRGCWTLFLTKDRINEKDGHDWGFMNVETGAYTPWGPYVKAREEEAARG